MELNGRSEGVPWSLRQCGVYQQICLETQRSSWILLHVSTRMRAKLDQALRSKIYQNAHRGIDSMLPHMIFLSAMAGNWQDHLEYLRSQLAFFVSPTPCLIPWDLHDLVSCRMKKHVFRRLATASATTTLSLSETARIYSYFDRSSSEHPQSLTHAWTLSKVAKLIAASSLLRK